MDKHYTYHHQWPVQIRFNDIDPMGHVNNATFQEYFDLGRMYYLNLIFDGALQRDGMALVVASINTDFLKSIYLDDKIAVQSKVVKLGNKSLTLMQQVLTLSGDVKAVSKSVMVCVDIASNATCIIPADWRQRVAALEMGDL